MRRAAVAAHRLRVSQIHTPKTAAKRVVEAATQAVTLGSRSGWAPSMSRSRSSSTIGGSSPSAPPSSAGRTSTKMASVAALPLSELELL